MDKIKKKLIIFIRKKKSKKIKKILWFSFFIIANTKSFIHKKKYINNIKNILDSSKNYKDIIIYPSNNDWYDLLYQRPHHLAFNLSQKNYLVFYCSPTINKKKFIEINNNLYACGLDAINSLKTIKSPILFINTHFETIKIVKKFKYKKMIYDYLDDLNLWIDNEKMKNNHNYLIQNSDLVITTADILYNEVKQKHKNVILCNNAVDYDFFHSPKPVNNNQIYSDIENIKNKKLPIIGYYGALARWFDWELLEYCLKERQKYNFVLIGRDYDFSFDKKKFSQYKNLFFLGEKPYITLPTYLSFFDVAIIPFKINEITQSTSPVKLFEYMAGGKPIVTTNMPECAKYKSVIISSDKNEFLNNLEKAIFMNNNLEYKNILNEEAKKNSWENRVNKIINNINKIS